MSLPLDAVLFDAGGVLVLPDPTVLSPLLAPYGGATSVDVTMEITFEDGRKSTLNSTIAIHGNAAAEPARKAA